MRAGASSRTQDEIVLKGAAIECRINAEDPYNNFLPSTGRITAMTVPSGPGVRVDSGVTTGDMITPYYDPMIAKLICWGDTRGEALLRMRRALSEYRIMGVKTNIPSTRSCSTAPASSLGCSTRRLSRSAST